METLTLSNGIHELTMEELDLVAGGCDPVYDLGVFLGGLAVDMVKAAVPVLALK